MTPILGIIGIFGIFVLVVAAAIRYRSLSPELRVLFYYFVIDLVLSLAQVFLALVLHQNNLWTTHVLLPFEYTFFMWAFSCWITNPAWKRFVLVSIPGYLFVWLVTLFTVEHLTKFSVVGFPLKSLLFLIVAVYLFLSLLRDTAQPLTSQPRFWILSGVLLYNAGNIMFILYPNYALQLSMPVMNLMWSIHNVIGITAYLSYLGGFLCRHR